MIFYYSKWIEVNPTLFLRDPIQKNDGINRVKNAPEGSWQTATLVGNKTPERGKQKSIQPLLGWSNIAFT